MNFVQVAEVSRGVRINWCNAFSSKFQIVFHV